MKLERKVRLCSAAAAVLIAAIALTGCGGSKTTASSAAASSVAASTAAATNNSCGEGVTWALADGTLTISGTGRMTNFTKDAPAPWADQADQITTHFEYHSMEENLLKLDMLGHDDPTMIRMMEDMTGIDAKTIPLDDKDTMSIFISSKVLGYEDDKILGPTGAVAIPEFNTRFTRGMLMDTMPTRFDTLLRLSGFSHGTDVWLGNAKDLITSKTATVDQAIGCRDDIMLYLISCGMPEKRSFKIMEAVRKGRGLPEGAEEEMKAAGVPEWYIGSCKKIKYLFPKAHAVAYVMMAFRIAWFKVHHPLAFYSAYFYRRSQKGGFDAVLMTHGKDAVVANIDAIENNENATDKDEDLLTTLEVAYEYYIRGFEFLPISIYDSHATKFIIKDGKLLPPLSLIHI